MPKPVVTVAITITPSNPELEDGWVSVVAGSVINIAVTALTGSLPRRGYITGVLYDGGASPAWFQRAQGDTAQFDLPDGVVGGLYVYYDDDDNTSDGFLGAAGAHVQ